MAGPSQRHIWLAYAMGITSGVLSTLIYKQSTQGPEDADLRQYTEVRDFVTGQYVKAMGNGEFLTRSMRGMAESLDPYSRFYDVEESANLPRKPPATIRASASSCAACKTSNASYFACPDPPRKERAWLQGMRS